MDTSLELSPLEALEGAAEATPQIRPSVLAPSDWKGETRQKGSPIGPYRLILTVFHASRIVVTGRRLPNHGVVGRCSAWCREPAFTAPIRCRRQFLRHLALHPEAAHVANSHLQCHRK